VADLSKVIEIIFEGTDSLGPTLTTLTSSTNQLATAVEGATAPIADFTNSLLKWEAVMVAVSAAALGFAINEAAKMEEALLDLQKVMGEDEGAATDYQDAIEDLALAHGENGVAAVQMAADLKQAGYSMEEILGPSGMLDLSLRAVKISELEAGEAAEWMARTLAAWGAPLTEAERLLDTVNYTSDVSTVSFEELAVAMQSVGPVASAAGFSFEELEAMMVPVISSLGSGEEAATAISAVFSTLINPVGMAADAFKELGIPLTDASGGFTTVREKLDALVAIWPTLTEEEQLYYSRLIAGKEHVDAFIKVMESFSGELTASQIATEASGSSLKEWEVRVEAANTKAAQAVESLRQMVEAIGSQFLANFSSGAEAVTALGQAMESVVEGGGLEPLFEALRPLFAEFTAALEQIAANLPAAFQLVDFDPLIAAIGNLTGAFGELFAGIDLSTPEGLAKAIQVLVDAFAGLINITAGIADTYIVPFAEALLAATDAGGNLNPEIQEAIGQFLGFSTSINTVLNVGAPLVGILTNLGLAYLVFQAPIHTVVAAAGTAIAGLGSAAAVASPVLTALGAVWLGWSLSDTVTDMLGLTDAIDREGAAAKEAQSSNDELAQAYAEITERTGVVVTSTEDLNNAIEQNLLVYDEQLGTYVRVEEQLIDMGTATEQAATQTETLTGAAQTTSTAVEVLRGASSTATSDILRLGVGMSSTAGEADKVAGELNKVSYEANKLPEEIKLELDATSIQANTQVATESLQSLSSTIESTGALLDTLFGLLIQNPDSPYIDKILEQIETENDLREQAFELQKQMIEAYVQWLEARTEALNSGEALIQIDGGNLQPHLEAFMWEILSAIQVRVNEEGLELLVGL
jgi:TP901 family phage tail tape measure protein